MIIHSKFSDYYDGVMGMGVDETIHYVRTEKSVAQSVISDRSMYEAISRRLNALASVPRRFRIEDDDFPSLDCTAAIVAIGGQLFQGLMVRDPRKRSHFWCQNSDDIRQAFVALNREFDETCLQRWSFNYLHSDSSRYMGLDEMLANDAKLDLTSLMIELNAPVLLFSQGAHDRAGRFEITKNAELKSTGIVSRIDPYTTFQEISMFISNVLCCNEPDIIDIADIHKRDAKGFDDISFKNRGTKKPRKRGKST